MSLLTMKMPNKHVNLTVKNVTPFAIAKVAPFLPAGYGGRWFIGSEFLIYQSSVFQMPQWFGK
jgi:hypothetical protein